MATSRGRADVQRFFAQAPEKLTRVLRGAARAGANVIADEASDRCVSPEVRTAIKVATRRTDGTLRGLVQVKGPGAHIGPWLEYGTSAHFISVDDEQREGRTVGRINRQAKDPDASHSLVINGKFVGATVLHPGARPHPFLRVALDVKAVEARSAAQTFINSRVSSGGIADANASEGDDT